MNFVETFVELRSTKFDFKKKSFIDIDSISAR